MHTRQWIALGLVLALSLPSAANAATAQEKAKAAEIANTIRDSGQLSNFRIGVKFEDGQAVLLGDVTDGKQAKKAMNIARKITGVEKVANRLNYTNAASANKTANALHVEQRASGPASKPQEESGVLLALSGPESSADKAATGKLSKAVQPAEAIKPVDVVPPAEFKKPTRAPQLRRVATRPANNMPRPVAYTHGRPQVQPAAYGGGGGPQPASFQPGAGNGAGGFESPQLPGYAWPSYAAPQNYSALTYPRQYSPTAWPYIGPFYPYPQVPLGWRKVTLEWDDGWWFLDFSHHQTH